MPTTAPEAQRHLTLPFFHEAQTAPFRLNEVLRPGTIIIDYQGERHHFKHGAIIIKVHTRQISLTWSPHTYCSEVMFVWYEPIT